MVNTLDFSPTDAWLVSAGSRDAAGVHGQMDGSVRIWDLPNQKVAHELPGHLGAVASVAFSPDGRYVLSGGGFPEDDGPKMHLVRVPKK